MTAKVFSTDFAIKNNINKIFMLDKSDLIRRIHFWLQISVNCVFTETRREKQLREEAEPSLIK